MKRRKGIISIYISAPFVCLLMVLGLFTGSVEGAKAHLTNVEAVQTQEGLLVSALLDGAFTPDISEAVSSGAPTSFRFLLRIIKRRALWFDKKIQEAEIHHIVVYDVLKKEYLVTRSFPDGSEESLSTMAWEEMTGWMNRLDSVSIALSEIKDPTARYHLDIHAEMKCIRIPFPLNYLLAFVSLWNFDTPWVSVPIDISQVNTKKVKRRPYVND